MYNLLDLCSNLFLKYCEKNSNVNKMKQMLDLALSNVQISVTELHANLMNASFAYLKYLYLFQKTCNTKQ